MDFLTCKFCNELYFSYECHICKYEDCIPSIMEEINGCDFQIPLQDCCEIQDLSSSVSESDNPSVSFGFDNLNYCLYEEKSFLQDKAALPINPAYMNDETACNLPNLESNKSRYSHDYMEISPPASPYCISEISNQKANILFVYQQINDNYSYVHDVETQINPTTEQYCCNGNHASGYIKFANQVSELCYEQLPRNNSFAVHQQFAPKKGNLCISAFREASINPSSADFQRKSLGNSKWSKQLCNGGSIDLSLEKKLNEHPEIHSSCQSFNSDICLTEFIHGSTLNKKNPPSADIQLKSLGNSKSSKQICNDGSIDLSLEKKFNKHPVIHSNCQSFNSDSCLTEFIHGSAFRDSAIVVAGPSLSMSFKKKEIINERKGSADDEPTAIDLSKPLNDKPICPECVKQLNSKKNLESHLKIHSEENRFVCGSCHKSFGRKVNLKYHISITTGKKAFKCPFCKKKFL